MGIYCSCQEAAPTLGKRGMKSPTVCRHGSFFLFLLIPLFDEPYLYQHQMSQLVRTPSSESKMYQASSPADFRVTTVDVLRGLAIVLMPIDHAREFFSSYRGNPLDPVHTTTALYFTRWITHLCAPIFVVLAGAAISLATTTKTYRRAEVSVDHTRTLVSICRIYPWF
jgi:hypothetical protein